MQFITMYTGAVLVVSLIARRLIVKETFIQWLLNN